MLRTDENRLSIYPISAGNELNVFATQPVSHIRILNLRGELMSDHDCPHTTHCIINIRDLPNATYFAEVDIDGEKPIRYAFVKL